MRNDQVNIEENKPTIWDISMANPPEDEKEEEEDADDDNNGDGAWENNG